MKKLLLILVYMLMAVKMLGQDTKTISVAISDFPAGTMYAANEMHDFKNGLVIYTNTCYFTSELRIYSSSTYNGFVISDPLPGTIKSMSFNMGHKKDVLEVYGSTDKENWTLVKGIKTTSTSYEDYTLSFPSNANYTCFKLDVKGSEQIRIKSMAITYIGNGNDDSNEDEDEGGNEGGSGNTGDKEEEIIIVSAPIFTPVSTSFSTEYLDVTIEAAEGCDIYYTKDGTTPSYANAEEYVGTKSNVATILASDSKVTLQAIAVDPTTGKCSSISSATYNYVSITNDGSAKRPYIVPELIGMTGSKTNKWVKGTIYGVFVDGNLITSNFKESIRTHIVIGDEHEYIAVQLPSGNVRTELNLVDHPYLRGKEILIKGTLEGYLLPKGLGVKSPSEYEVFYDVPISSYGYATLFLDIPVEVSAGCTAYYCTIEEGYAKLLPIGSIIPANVGVILECAPNTICRLTYTTNSCAEEETIRKTNQMVGFIEDTIIPENGNTYYALNVKDNKLGFYMPQTTDSDGIFTAKANKAYLEAPTEMRATMFLIHRENDETDIISAKHMTDNTFYDLQGRKVLNPTLGIYIKDGKKVVIE